MVSIGGFVIHDDAHSTLGACLDSLTSVADEVVAVDSGSCDGSGGIASSRGIRRVALPWQGYGAARARATELLARHDYVFFLDADETLSAGAVDAFRAWRASGSRLPYYRLRLEDWAEIDGRRFLYRRETKKRLVRRDMAAWRPEMIVHESLPRAREGRLEAVILHRFVTSLSELERKQRRYALLWALAAHVRGRRAPSVAFPGLRIVAHVLRDGLLKGAWLRGGRQGWHLSRTVAFYHAEKYRSLAAIERGEHAALVAHLRRGELEALFRALPGSSSGAPGARRKCP